MSEAARRHPLNLPSLIALGNAYGALGKWHEAERIYQEALALAPDSAEAYNRLGVALRALGRREEAASCCQRAVVLRPELVEAHNNLGTILESLGRIEEAGHSYRRAIALNPGIAIVHNNLGMTQAALGQLKEAERSYRHALALAPDCVEALNNLGNLYAGLGRLDDAERSYRLALAMKPDLAEVHYNLGNALMTLHRPGEAEQSYRRALARKPDYAEAYCDLGNAVAALGRREEAEACYRQALRLRPGYPEALSQWVHQCQWLCAWQDLGEGVAALHRHVATQKTGRLNPGHFNVLPENSAAAQLDCARQYTERLLEGVLARAPLHGRVAQVNRERRRIGYLSGDFRVHAVSNLLAEVMERHDRGRFELFGYSHGVDDRSRMRARMQAALGTFRDIRQLSNDAAARQIAADGIDILVDLNGLTEPGRLGILGLRPAPVQVNWLGYPGTLGHPALADYLIGDPIVTPPAHARHYSETLALMPHCYQPNDRQRTIAAPPPRAQAGLPESGFIFCCFCQPYKITPAMFDLWCRILRGVPGSHLWLLAPNPAAQENIRREAAGRGVAPARLLFAPSLPPEEHLARMQLADLALDTFPYTSHTTASDALWLGIPIVTRIGDMFISRVAASILHAAGLPELVTHDPDAYCDKVIELATRPERMARVRKFLKDNRTAMPLFDSDRFARDLERLYERMWADHVAGRKDHLFP